MLFADIQKRVLSRNFDQSLFINVYFWKKKTVKISAAPGAPNPRLPQSAGGSTPRPPRCYSHLLLQLFPVHSKTRFKQKFRPKYVNKCVFLKKKTVKISAALGESEPAFASGSWGLRPQTPALLLPLAITTLSSSFLTQNTFYCPQRKNNYAQ